MTFDEQIEQMAGRSMSDAEKIEYCRNQWGMICARAHTNERRRIENRLTDKFIDETQCETEEEKYGAMLTLQAIRDKVL